ncbi:MAG: LysM peptidoglycan-binding domain-containing protein [Ectothiorhodospiraceae bacterium]|nr:LysM peptidoglycan-binding domain-containing protein [Ectothiorhodospiraceae bacterium]
MTFRNLLLIAVSCAGLSACAQLPLGSDTDERDEQTGKTKPAALWPEHLEAPRALTAEAPPAVAVEPSPYPDDLWARMRHGFGMEAMVNERVASELAYYSRHPRYMDRVAERATPYLYHIVSELEVRDMPAELALLPIVESAYQPFAYSHGRAAGIWQFIPGTGRHFGLKQTWWYDGRRDIIASTEAALTYLERLHNMFDGDWELALASYNAGEGTVMRAIRRNAQAGKPTDYWNLPLPRETRNYVPRLLALRALIEDPQQFNIELASIPDEPYLGVVDAGSQIDLALAAELADLELDEFYLLNPGFNRWATDPEGPHTLALPLDRIETFEARLAEVPADERVRFQRHQVQSGETLSQIARRYGTTVSALQETNNLNGHVIRAGSHLLVPTSSRPAEQYALSADQRLQQTQNRQRNGQRIQHTVQRGDTFWGLSRRYGVEVRQLAQWNSMAPGDTLRPGQELVLWVAASGATQPASGSQMMQRVNYTVRQGDSLYRIAQRFRVSVNDLRRWNNLPEGRHLQPGQRLTLHVDVRAQSGSI